MGSLYGTAVAAVAAVAAVDVDLAGHLRYLRCPRTMAMDGYGWLW